MVYLSHRLLLILVCSCLIFPVVGQAQQAVDPLNLHIFQSPIDALGLISTERARGLSHLKINLGLMIDGEGDSLRFRYANKDHVAMSRLTSGQLSFAIGFWDRITVGVSQSLHIIEKDLDGPEGNPSVSDDGLGDTRLSLKGVILDSDLSTVGLALMLETRWAFGDTLEYASDRMSPLIIPWLIFDSAWSRAAISLNAGYALRAQGTVAPTSASVPLSDPIVFGPEVMYRGGLSIFYVPRFLHHTFEVIGGQGISPEVTRPSHLEVISGLKLIFNKGSYLTFGGGHGFLSGYSQPKWRAFIGITFRPKASDSDGDGILDEKDACVNEAEDLDGFEDQDGCPEPDNDQDGFRDLYDQCPNDPEDFNDFEDQDGCPDGNRDLDRDGIIDPKDDCPTEAEDLDGFSDGDGCPDIDNDQDGKLDVEDRCPNDPEDIDGFEDQDGCPDPDNDQDQVPDIRDKCPETPEDLDGDADDDGCPETSSQLVTDEGARLQIKGKVFFDINKATIKSDSYLLLLEIARFINERPQITLIEVQGHTDRQGSREYNIDLSRRRAEAVMRYLIDEGSVNPDRLRSKGYGFDMPLEEGSGADAAARNRRVEFVVLQRDQ